MRKILFPLLILCSAFFNYRAFAALAVDASTPAAITGVSSEPQNVTTASFTPPAGSVLYVLICLNSNAAGVQQNALNAITDNLGTHLAYTLQLAEGNINTNDTLAYLYTAPVVTSHAMTVTVTQESSNNSSAELSLLQVLVVTGADPTNPVGKTGGGRGAAGPISDIYNASNNNSWGWLIYADWNGAAAPTAGAGQTVYASYANAGQVTYSVIQQNSTTAAAYTPVTMSTTAPNTGQIAHIFFEMMAAPSTSPSGSTITNARIYNAYVN